MGLAGQFVGDAGRNADQQWSTGLWIDQQFEQGVMLLAARVDRPAPGGDNQQLRGHPHGRADQPRHGPTLGQAQLKLELMIGEMLLVLLHFN